MLNCQRLAKNLDGAEVARRQTSRRAVQSLIHQRQLKAVRIGVPTGCVRNI